MSLSWTTTYSAPDDPIVKKFVSRGKPKDSWDKYSDDGTVVTLDVRDFFNGITEYIKFFENGARAYFSLTVDGVEAYQFGPPALAKIGAGTDIQSIKFEKEHLSVFIEDLFNRASHAPAQPIILGKGKRSRGVLYPMFERTIE